MKARQTPDRQDIRAAWAAVGSKTRAVPFALVLAGALLPTAAHAACTLCSCSVTTNGLAFGSYDATSATARDATATIAVSCSAIIALNGTVSIAMSPGGSGNAAARRMTKGSDTLNYQIYTNAARSTIWGNGSGGTSTVTVSVTSILFSTTVYATAYARIPAHQYVRPGAYSDTVTVTITY